MKDKDLRRLTKTELLTVIYEQQKKLEARTQELEEAKAQLESRRIALEKSGSIAEAALELNGVFEAAQKSVEQYLENVRSGSPENAEPGSDKAVRLRSAGRDAGVNPLGDALAAQTKWDDIRKQFDDYIDAHIGLRDLLDSLGLSFDSIFGRQQIRGSKE